MPTQTKPGPIVVEELLRAWDEHEDRLKRRRACFRDHYVSVNVHHPGEELAQSRAVLLWGADGGG